MVGNERAYTEPKLLSAATAPASRDEIPNPPGGAPSNRRRASRYGLAALLVLALFSALLLRCGESTTSRDKSATRAAPKADRAPAVRAPQNGATSAQGNVAIGSFTMPSLPTNGPASDFTGSAFASLPGAAPGPVTPPVQYSPPSTPGPTQIPQSPQPMPAPNPTPGPQDISGSL